MLTLAIANCFQDAPETRVPVAAHDADGLTRRDS